jgi:hypothetical protein
MDDQRLEEIAGVAFEALIHAEDEGLGCQHADVNFACQWNHRAPCEQCAALETRYRDAIREALSSQEEELRKVREELETWKRCANCHEPLQYPGYCQNAHGEEVQGLNLMLDEAIARAESAEAELTAANERGDRWSLLAQEQDREFQRLKEVLARAKPRHYAGECLICHDDEPCPTLALIAEIDRLLAYPAEQKVT